MSSAESLSLDGFWMEVERIQQRDELREEDGSGGEGRPPEGEECWQGLLGGGRPLWQGRHVQAPGTDHTCKGFISLRLLQ